MFIVKKKETVEVVKETFTVTISKKRFNEQKDDIKKFMEETLDETELDIVDIIHKNDKVKIIAEKISETQLQICSYGYEHFLFLYKPKGLYTMKTNIVLKKKNFKRRD